MKAQKTWQILLLIIGLLVVQVAQAMLNPGDIAFVQYNADNPDSFAFVALVNIPANTEIKFTDKGWLNSNTFRSREELLTWLSPITADVVQGTIVTIEDGAASLGNTGGSMPNLAEDGDQIIAYQGTDTMIAALNNEGSTTWQNNADSPQTSMLPKGLINDINAIALEEVDNAKYVGPLIGDRATLLQAINNYANWTGHDSTAQIFLASFTIITPKPDRSVIFPISTAPPPDYYELIINIEGQGIVFDHRGWINCGNDLNKCQDKIEQDLEMKLKAQPAANWHFDGWQGDCLGLSKTFVFTMTGKKACTAIFSKQPEKIKLITPSVTTTELIEPTAPVKTTPITEVGVYSLVSSTNEDYVSFIRMTNITYKPIAVTATLYNEYGQTLGNPNTLLPTLKSQQTVGYSAQDLENLLNTVSWTNNVWLQLKAVQNSLRVMHMLRNPDATLTNLSLSTQNALYNLPNKTNADELFILFINTSNQTLTNITGTFYASSGQIVGNANALLLPEIGPKAIQTLTAKMLEQRLGNAWSGHGWLKLEPSQPTIQLISLLKSRAGTFSNMSAIASDNTLYNLPGSLNQDQAYVKIINTIAQTQQIRGTLFDISGQILGQPDAILVENLPAHAMAEFKMQTLEKQLGIPPWPSKNRLVITSSTAGVVVSGTITSSSGNITNASSTKNTMLYNLSHWTNKNQDTPFIRITNTTEEIQQIRGTLWHMDGYPLSSRNTLLVEALQPHGTAGIDIPTLESVMGIPAWKKHARLEITAPITGTKVMSMSRSKNNTITNLSSTVGN